MNLDLGYLAQFVGFAISDQVQGELAEQGFRDLRYAHGFLIQHLIEADRTVGELARRMEISQQAVSKTVGELVRLGYLEHARDPSDGRVTRVRLAHRGLSAVTTTRVIRAALERKLSSRLGEKRLATAKKILSDALEVLGGADAMRNRRVRPPR